jgi:RimJ/RimL family protein N-acetyltransferase
LFFGQLVKLRGLELSDLDTIMQYWNDLELREYLDRQIPHSRVDEENFIRMSWDLRNKNQEHIFAIETKDGKWLGTCGLHNMNQINRSATLGIAIHRKDLWGKGYGTDAVKTLCAIGFDTLNLHRIELEYFEGNKRGANTYPKLGFKEIGRRREGRFFNGRYTDVILMDLLRREFKEKFPNFNLYHKVGPE